MLKTDVLGRKILVEYESGDREVMSADLSEKSAELSEKSADLSETSADLSETSADLSEIERTKHLDNQVVEQFLPSENKIRSTSEFSAKVGTTKATSSGTSKGISEHFERKKGLKSTQTTKIKKNGL